MVICTWIQFQTQKNPTCVPSCALLLLTGTAKKILSSTKVCAVECPESGDMYLDSVTDSENPACVPSCKLTTGAAKTYYIIDKCLYCRVS